VTTVAETALITGASGGIGEDLSRLIAESGANVVLVARNAAKLERLGEELSRKHGITASVIAVDLAHTNGAEHVVRELSGRGLTIDILVNNAGFGTSGLFWEIPAEDDRELLQVNVVSLTLLTKLLLPGMVQRRHGRILNVASTAAFQPGPLMAVYYASKAYVLSLSEALATETRGTGVTVTCLCPGPTRTGFQARARLGRARLFKLATVMSSADVARAGYEGMRAGKTIVIPGALNKVGVQALRAAPRAFVRHLVRYLQSEGSES
jgi:short-subunit dehydrogenase